MIQALLIILDEPKSLNLIALTTTWAAHSFTEQEKTDGSEAEITQMSFDLLKIVCHSVNSLESPRRVEQQPQYTNDGQVKC
jgi:hypothetical protein